MKIFLTLFTVLAIPFVCFSATWYVPDDYPLIQAAIDSGSVVGGDLIIVRPGIYVENIDFKGKAITVKSEDGPASTIIDGGKPSHHWYGSTVAFKNGEGRDSVLDGFTVTNGSGTYDQHYSHHFGGGIYCKGSSPTITNNIITGNWAFVGGGITPMYDANPLISNNIIITNLSEGGGAGIWFRENASPVITNNTISGNLTTDMYSYGGGIFFTDPSTTIITNNIISWNSATWGGGMYFGAVTSPTISYNTISNNKAVDCGGGLYIAYYNTALIKNMIVWGNQALENPGIGGENSVSITYSNIQDGWPGVGNIDADPLFVDPLTNDFHLTRLSPCINRGTYDGTPSHDIDNDPRPYMGTVDMGADEFVGPHPLECDTFTISESSGGILNFTLKGGTENAGRNYLIYGSISGTAPGTPLPGGIKNLPINWDFFTNIVANVNYPDSILFTNFHGTLDINGNMTAGFDTNGPVRGMAGHTISFAYPLQGPPWDFSSNPINIEVIK